MPTMLMLTLTHTSEREYSFPSFPLILGKDSSAAAQASTCNYCALYLYFVCMKSYSPSYDQSVLQLYVDMLSDEVWSDLETYPNWHTPYYSSALHCHWICKEHNNTYLNCNDLFVPEANSHYVDPPLRWRPVLYVKVLQKSLNSNRIECYLKVRSLVIWL